MKEILKKDLISQLTESMGDIDEMGYQQAWQKGVDVHGRKEKGETQGIDPTTGQVLGAKASKFKPMVGPTGTDKTPEVWVISPTGKVDDMQAIYCLEHEEDEEMIRKNPKIQEWLEKFVEPISKGAPLRFVDMVSLGAKRAKIEYLRKQPETVLQKLSDVMNVDLLKLNKPGRQGEEKESTPTTPREKLLRSMGPDIRNFVESTQKDFYIKGFPPLMYVSQTPREQKKFADRYAEKGNDYVIIRTKNFYGFNNYKEFMEYSDNLLDLNEMPPSEDLEIKKGESMARQYNPNQSQRWSGTRKQDKTSDAFKRDPLTKTYKLEKEGKKAEEYDYLIYSEMTIVGELIKEGDGEKYKWSITVVMGTSEKLREAASARGFTLKPEHELYSDATTMVFPGGIDYDKTQSIYSEVVKVRKALMVAMEGIKKQIQSFNAIPMLQDRIFKKRSEVTKKFDLSENEIVELVKNTISEKIK